MNKQRDIWGNHKNSPNTFHRNFNLIVKILISDHEFMVLTDMTSPYTRPAILDIKMGKRTYDPLADREKQEKEVSKYPALEIIGFRLLGYKVIRSISI